MELRAQRPAALAALALLAALLLAAAPARADDLKLPKSLTEPPAGYRLTGKRVIAIASTVPKIRAERRRRGKLEPFAYVKGGGAWQVSFFGHDEELGQVAISDATGAVTEAWTGPQVAWRMARGYPGAFAGRLCAWYLWLPLCLLFAAPFVDPRRPFRMLHLDIVVLLAGFGLSHFFFNRGEISTSVPLAYPPLVYLLVRLLWVGFRGQRAAGSGRLTWARPAWLALALVFLVGFRVALNVADSNVIDVGYAGVLGADKIAHGKPLYDGRFHRADNEHGDTYGPVNYLLYMPFEAIWPSTGKWDDLPAAHAATIAFDLLTLLGLLVLGRRLRAGPPGRALGIALAYAWATFPYTLYAVDSNSNDTLVAAVLVWALVAISSAPARGLLIGLGAAAKFVPLALAPLFAPSGSAKRGRGALIFALVLVLVLVLAFSPFIPHGGLHQVWERTLGYQTGRDSPFSIWGQHAGLTPLWTAVKVAAAALAVAVGFVPRRRTPAQVAALGGAVLVALQLAAAHWFYLYIVWFLPFALVALMWRYDPEPDSPPPAAPRAERPADLALA